MRKVIRGKRGRLGDLGTWGRGDLETHMKFKPSNISNILNPSNFSNILDIRNLDQIRKYSCCRNCCAGTIAFDEHW